MILYKVVKFYVKTGLHLFYKNIRVSGKENIPKNGPILFVANHQNAMMDPLVVATATNNTMYFLARASAFKKKIASKLLRSIHAIAIYRVRDGVNSKALNEAVFNECLGLFNEKQNILIFPEGSHSQKRQVRSLRAGFVRMTIDYLIANPTKNLKIVPVGLNYSDTFNYAEKLHVVFGEPINSRQFFNEDDINTSRSKLINEVHQKLKNVTVHIDSENYENVYASLTKEDFLNPIATNKKIDNEIATPKNNKQKKKNIFYYLLILNSIVPFLIWGWLKPKIKELEFISTAKFSLGLTIFPINYFIQTIFINAFFGNVIAFTYVLFTFILVFLSTKTR